MEAKNLDSQPEEQFTGFCRFVVVDSDGIFKKVLGSIAQVPVHRSISSPQDYIFTVSLPPEDPIHYLELSRDEDSVLLTTWYYGSSISLKNFITQDQILAEASSFHCYKKLAEMKENQSTTFSCRAYCPFLQDTYSQALNVTFYTAKLQMKTCVSKVTLTMPMDAYNSFMKYHAAIQAYIKEKKGNSDDDKKKKDE